ncbi:FAD-dependent oxidoreductase [Pacificimonas sp. ICDLI1SI03]
MTPANPVDMVVVGSGAGGLSAAVKAASLGLKVHVLEKTDRVGGSTAISGGVVWIANNSAMADHDAPDPPGAARHYLEQVLGSGMRAEMVDAYLSNGARMVDFLNNNTDVQLRPRMYAPDYQSELEGASGGGRALDPIMFDGRKLGRWFKRLRGPLPQMTIFGGMMVGRADIDHLSAAMRKPRSFVHAFALFARHAGDRMRHRRGTRLLAGNALAARLLKSALDLGVTFTFDAQVDEITMAQGRVTGLAYRHKGVTCTVIVNKAVVLAAGGTAANSAFRTAHVPHSGVHRSMAPLSSTGDGIALARAVGAAIEDGNESAVFLAPVSVHEEPGKPAIAFPHLILDRQKPGLIAVNSAGRRFCNEADSYHDFVTAMYRDGPDGPAVPAWLIADDRFVSKYGLGLVKPRPFRRRTYSRSGYLVSAPDLPELASRIKVPVDALQETVARANRWADSGVDEDFGRGSTKYNRYLGDPSHAPNPCLGPIRKAPFHAVKVWPGDIGSTQGLLTDGRARVLDDRHEPIAGLYACGNDMNSIMRGTYPAGGITLGPAMTFGYIAARDAAGNLAEADR